MPETSRTELTTESETDTRELGRSLGGMLTAGDLISLTGDLGAGKTRFAQGVAAGLGVLEPVTSPTFTIMRLYEGRLPFFHFDVYRLRGAAELIPLGYEEYFYGDGVTLVEWGDKVLEALPKDYLRLEIHRDLKEPNRRLFIVEAGGARSQLLLSALSRTA